MTFMAIIGMMGLIGMMVKNAIVLVDEINRLQTEEKKMPYTAVIEATVSRVRPVLMASLTTIVGMIPLITDHNGRTGSRYTYHIDIVAYLLYGTFQYQKNIGNKVL